LTALRVDGFDKQRQWLDFTLAARSGQLLSTAELLQIVDLGIAHLQFRRLFCQRRYGCCLGTRAPNVAFKLKTVERSKLTAGISI